MQQQQALRWGISPTVFVLRAKPPRDDEAGNEAAVSYRQPPPSQGLNLAPEARETIGKATGECWLLLRHAR